MQPRDIYLFVMLFYISGLLYTFFSLYRVNVPIVVQSVVVQMCLNGFKVSEKYFFEYLITYQLEYVLSSQFYHQTQQIYEKIHIFVTASLYL